MKKSNKHLSAVLGLKSLLLGTTAVVMSLITISCANEEISESVLIGETQESAVSLAGNTFTIKSSHSGKYLDVSNFSTSNGGNIHQWEYTGNKNQQWEVISVGNNTYQIKSVHSGKSLDVEDVSIENGGNIQQWNYAGGDNQKWYINEVNTDVYNIISVKSGKAIDVAAWSKKNGGNIHQWTYGDQANQKWIFELVDGGSGDDDDDGTGDDDDDDGSGDDDDDDDDVIVADGTPLAAFDEFNPDSVTVSFDGDEITLESTALPNHTSPYWPTNSPLYIDQIVGDHKTPGTIRARSYTLTVSNSPEIATTSTATGLGAIGISVTGVPIFNDQEGPNLALDANTASGFDYAGGHNGPSGYHYHVESSDIEENTVLSHDDDDLIGIMMDGFLLYGRRENSTGEYPTDLDVSGGHVGPTQHSNGEVFYHYHVINEYYIDSFIVLFAADLQGTPNSIL